MAKKYLKKKHKKLILKMAAGIFLLSLLLIIFFAEKKFSQLVVGGLGEQFSTRVYAAPAVVKSRQQSAMLPLSPESLVERLKRLGYKQVSDDPRDPGEFVKDGNRIKVFLNGFTSPFYNQYAMSIRLAPSSQGWVVADSNNVELDEVALEPEQITELSGTNRVRREPTTWEEIPVRLADAVIAVEDAGFYHHWGISPKGVIRAALSNITGKKGIQGGSTITQQLAKNLFLSPKRTLRRKAVEALFALYLEVRFSKEKILTLYLNHIYMGQDGNLSVAGVKSASEFYFGKHLSDLSLAECALLAGVIRSPFRYNPFRDLENSIERRNFVLQRMKAHEFITEIEYKRAVQEPVRLHFGSKLKREQDDNDYFVAECVRQLLPRYSEIEIFRTGLKIYTTMDPLFQKYAQSAVRKSSHQAALVAIEPWTGNVRALVGGKSYKESQFNRATQAARQPGSAFKPFAFAAGLEKNITAASLLTDKPKTFSDGRGGKWLPKNYGGLYKGTVTVRQALSHSLNSATLDLVQQIGADAVVDFAKRAGIISPIEKSLAVGLGVSEVNLLELTAGYAAFNNGGYSVVPQLIIAVVDAEDNTLEINSPTRVSIIDPALAFVMTSLLQSTVEEGTAAGLPKLGWPYKSAGKTGTTNEGRDAWFIGYSPELLTGVWVGDDKAKSISVAGASNALPIWALFMTNSYKGVEPLVFEQPAGIITLKIDPLSGKSARSGCPNTISEVFIKGTEPMEPCPIHAGGVKGLFEKWFKTN